MCIRDSFRSATDCDTGIVINPTPNNAASNVIPIDKNQYYACIHIILTLQFLSNYINSENNIINM